MTNRSNMIPVWAGWLLSLACMLPAGLSADEKGDLTVGPALKGAWLNNSMPGQGFIIEVVENPRVMFIGWFVFPRDSEDVQSDHPNHRWYTIQGNWSDGNTGTQAGIYQTTGGAFLGPQPIQTSQIGSATIRFTA